MHIHTNNRTHFSLRVSGDSQQTLALRTQVWENSSVCLTSPPSCSSLWTGQHRLPPSQAKCWQSLLSSRVTLLHGLSDGLSTLPSLSTVHTVMKYDLISVSAALSVTPHCLKLCHSNFLHIYSDLFFPLFSSHLCYFGCPESLIQPQTRKSRSPWREIAQLSCQRLSLSVSSSLKCNLWHFLCGSLKSNSCSIAIHSKLSLAYAWHSKLILEWTYPHIAWKYLHL